MTAENIEIKIDSKNVLKMIGKSLQDLFGNSSTKASFDEVALFEGFTTEQSDLMYTFLKARVGELAEAMGRIIPSDKGENNGY